MLTISQLLSILKDATNRLPQLRFAWGLLGISAVAALIIRLLGANKASVIVIALTLIGTVLVFVATIAFGKSALAKRPAQLLVWSITVFFICFLGFTVSAFAISWPCNWTRFLDIPSDECGQSIGSGEKKAEADTRFDVKFGQATFIKQRKGVRAELKLRAFPLTKKNEEVATIFTGIVTVHNEELVDLKKDTNHAICEQKNGCLQVITFDNYTKNPLIVRGGNAEPIDITSFFDLPAGIKHIRFYWEFYQQEANNNNLCVIDSSKPAPADGIPYLKVVTRGGIDTKDACWRASDIKIVPVSF